MIRHLLTMLALGSVSLIMAPELSAQISSVEREVTASADDTCAGTDSDSSSSSALGSFSASVTAELPNEFPQCGPVSASSEAHQTSTVTITSIVAMGASSSGAAHASSSAADSTLTAMFELTSPATYTISGTLSGQIDDFFKGQTLAGPAQIQLTQGANIIFDVTQSTPAPEPFSLTGVLPPNVYKLEAVAPTFAIQNLSQTAAFDFTFTVPEPSGGLILGLAWLYPWSMRRSRL